MTDIEARQQRGLEHPLVVQNRWPQMPGSEWHDTRDTLHLWTQIVGKVRLALEPMVNQWWQVPLYVSARGLTTSLMPASGRGLDAEFDFVDHKLVIRTTDGDERAIALEPRSVANFFHETMSTLDDLGINVKILPRPVEIAGAIPFAEDNAHCSYDADAAHRFWLGLIQIDRIMHVFRSRFAGKSSPVHFFWGSFDMATTRFSGRRAPKHPGGIPNCPDWVQQLAYSHEVSSCGYWPGGDGEGMFYSYAYAEPEGFGDRQVRPDTAFYDKDIHEFFLPYEAVRGADDPDSYLLSFFQTTYDAAADLAHWDRAALEMSYGQ